MAVYSELVIGVSINEPVVEEPAVNPNYLARMFKRSDLPYDLRTIRLGGE